MTWSSGRQLNNVSPAPPLPRTLALSSTPFNLPFLVGWPTAGPGRQPCQPPDLISLFSKERQTVLSKGPKRCQGFVASRAWEMCGWQQLVGKWNSVLVTVVTTNALLASAGGEASSMVGWGGAAGSPFNSAYHMRVHVTGI